MVKKQFLSLAPVAHKYPRACKIVFLQSYSL